MKKKVKIYNWREYFKFKENLGSDVFEKEHFVKSVLAPNTYIYLRPSRFMFLRGLALASAVKVSFGDGTQNNLIVTDKYFWNLPGEVKRYLLLHEAGHVLNGDLEKKSSTIKTYARSLGYLPEMEVKADRHAASVMGVHAVQQAILYLVHRTNLPLTSKVEFMRRYYKLAA